jgi:transcriptional regulator with XRE-family HTH domain
MGLTVSQAAGETGLSEGTIKNIERGVSDPSFHALTRLLQSYEIPDDTMQTLLGLDTKPDPIVGNDSAEAHWKLLERFRGMAYHCLFVRDDIDKVRSLEIHPLAKDEQGGFLEASAEEGGRRYDCRVTCTMSARFVHFQLASGLAEACDRVNLLVPYPQKLAEERKFHAGVGAILSLSSLGGGDDTQWPCFQLAAIVERELMERLGKEVVVETCKKYLALPPEDHDFPGFGYRIGIRDIHARSHDLFRELVPKQE